MPVGKNTRALYRRFRQRDQAAVSGGAPPDPFDGSGGGKFLDWLRAPWPGRRWGALSRYLYAVYDSRVDLQAVYRETSDHGLDGLLD